TTFENNRKHRAFLLIAALILGTFSHVLFLAFAIAIFGIASLEGKPSRFITVVYCTALVFILVRMTLDLRKIGPVFLAGGAGITVAFFLAKKETYFSRATLLARPLFEIVAIPFFLLFLFLMWGGPWSYAQATGSLVFWWWPLNIVLLIALYLNSGRWNWTRDSTKFSWERRAWFGFVLSLIACNAMVYKPAPRYFVIPAIFLTIWAALAFDDYWQRSRFQPRARTLLGLSLVFAFIVNLFVFQSDYLNRFLTRPGLDREFRLWHFNDSARDFRPFQRVFSWAEKNGCALTLDWVEDDRFGLPLKFLQLDSKPTGKACPWHKKQLFFSHIPNFNSDLRIAERLRVGESIAHPQYGLRILAHEPEWGDLAIWIRDLP
ncbi:MAG TPA: hypothetical protein PLH57_00225, partial [Oligoflexia bacterium]|nr:hypothetical protein [Oligoflexia bacterium]